MRLPEVHDPARERKELLTTRQGAGPPPPSNGPDAGRIVVIVIVSLAVTITLISLAYIGLKHLRTRHARAPKWIPTRFLQRKWETWTPKGFRGMGMKSGGGTYSTRLQQQNGQDTSVPTLHLRGENRSSRASMLNMPPLDPEAILERAQTFPDAGVPDQHQEAGVDAAGVDRQTSVRSVMTLPAYSHSVRASERVLGREGERDGIDVLIEAPESEGEEEARRDDEMQSLYLIRVARRAEVAAREARREQRRAARARGDYAEVQRLRIESERVAEARRRGESDAQAMIVEHQSRPRDRRVSSVSYADLGVARHDGTRVRANSGESDRRPLLDEAANLGVGGANRAPWSHHREGSTSSMRSNLSDVSSAVSTTADMEGLPPFGRAGSDYAIVTLNSNNHASGSHSRTPSGQHHTVIPPSNGAGRRSRASSGLSSLRPLSVNTSTLDLGTERISASDSFDHDDDDQPPTYGHAAPANGFEDAPPYTSPVQERSSNGNSGNGHSAPRSAAEASTHSQRPQTPDSSTRTHQERSKQATFSPSGAPLLPEISRLPSIRVASATPVERTGRVPFPDF